MIDIYSMTLHQTVHEAEGNIDITKVHDGWIYYYVFRKSSIFVPCSTVDIIHSLHEIKEAIIWSN